MVLIDLMFVRSVLGTNNTNKVDAALLAPKARARLAMTATPCLVIGVSDFLPRKSTPSWQSLGTRKSLNYRDTEAQRMHRENEDKFQKFGPR